MALKEFKKYAEIIYPYFETLLLISMVLFAGYMYGYRARAEDTLEKANTWIEENCEEIGKACLLKDNNQFGGFNLSIDNGAYEINPNISKN